MWAGPGSVHGPFSGLEGTSELGGTLGEGPVAEMMKERYSQILDMSVGAHDCWYVCNLRNLLCYKYK